MSNGSRKPEESELYLELLEALLDDKELSELGRVLVDGALRGEAELEGVLANAGSPAPLTKRTATTTSSRPPPVFLQQIQVEGFRGAGPAATLDLQPGPGLTLVVGRNGTGKSTFAEGLETLLSGTTSRWEERKEWKNAWKNLAFEGRPRVAATLLAEGVGVCHASRTWEKDDDLGDGKFEVKADASHDARLDWRLSCQKARPFLGYRQLGTVVDKPADVFDALNEVLGLDLLANASERINGHLKALTARAKEAPELCKIAADALASSEEPRAAQLRALVKEKKPNLSDIESTLKASMSDVAHSPTLSAFCRAQLPPVEDWHQAIKSLTDALATYQDASTATAEQSAKLVLVLNQAIDILDASESNTCPVCSKPIADDELKVIKKQRDTLTDSSARFGVAKTSVNRAYARICALVQALPELGANLAGELQITPELPDAIRLLKRDALQSAQIASTALAVHEALPTHLAALHERAKVLLTERGEEFRRVTQPLAVWLEAAQQVAAESNIKKALTEAKQWLADATLRKRAERFQPLSDEALRNWGTLSSGSSVLLNSVNLIGQGNKRKIELEVEVDGAAAPGVGVLSQGEINCMALSLFLPRASRTDGPFRFVVIDDPVQAMDHVKVDGLAKVLHEAAKNLQVVVLTHDSRLMTSLWRLQLPCNVLEVRRSIGSKLTVHVFRPPHEKYLSDARRLARESGLGEELPRRLVPGFCRLAVEAACNQRIFKDRLAAGATFREVEDLLFAARQLQTRLALALLGDPGKAEEVPNFLKRNGGAGECSAVFQMNKTHGHGSTLTADDLFTLPKRARDLCSRVLGE